MKRLLLILILTFCFQSWTKADDIRDFQIEGISIGDSLLDFFSENEILSAKQKTQYYNDKFIVYQLHKLKSLNIYDGLNVSIKKNSKNYVLSHMQALIWYKNENEFAKCNFQRKKIENDLTDLFKELEKEDQKYLSSFDNKSPVEGVQFYFNSGEAIVINCNDWLQETGLTKNLDVAIATEEFFTFITEEAYK